MILETYKDNTADISNVESPALPQDVQHVGVVPIHNEIEDPDPAVMPENNKENPINTLIDDNNIHNDDENKIDVTVSPMQDEIYKKEQQHTHVLVDNNKEEFPFTMDNEMMPPMFDYIEEGGIQISIDTDHINHEYGSGRRLAANSEEGEDNELVKEFPMISNNNNDRDDRHSSAPESSNTPATYHQESFEEVSGTQDSIVASTKTDDDNYQEEEIDEDFLPTKIQANANPGSKTLPPVPQVTGCRTQGQIAVTYSEGPSDATAGIVRQLSDAEARGNFFVNASWLYTQQYAMVVQNTYKAGHFIGMTYRVKNDDSSKLTDKELRQDIIEKAHTIETLIHVAPKYVRLHYTEPEDTRTENMLKSLGFVLVGYNLDSQDYAHRDVNEVYSKAFKRYKETYDAKGSFISIQYDMPGTVKQSTVPQMINTISEEGYTMVRLDGCLNDPKPYKKSAESTEYVSDKFSFNTAGYHQGQNVVSKSIIEEAKQFDEANKEEDVSDSLASKNKIITYSLATIIGILGFVISILRPF
ncbi:hypothetical protein BDC45DRAFT_532642 [Circinella umbellata]|nr:hypothetical protein BDC45DRAFT_532642 [Circinella umbellata]